MTPTQQAKILGGYDNNVAAQQDAGAVTAQPAPEVQSFHKIIVAVVIALAAVFGITFFLKG